MNGQAKLVWAIIIVVIVIVAIIAVVLYVNSKSPLIPTAYSIQIVKGTATVKAGTDVYYKFNIPSGASAAGVLGTFTVQGGSGNGVKVYIFDSTNYNIYYHNGQDFASIYLSALVPTHTSSINVSALSSGTYYLVLDNKFSTISTKTVNIQATATYWKNLILT
jgi:hypothetical protein